MLLYGIEKNSLNDYPGKISCVLFTHGCNFFCPYCHNPQAVSKKNKNVISSKKILNFIKKRKKYYDGVVISGGEPTINIELPDLCHEIKKMGYMIKLDTNGSRPEIIAELLKKNMLDYIAMDIKTAPVKKLYKQLTNEHNITKKILRSINIIMDTAKNYEFRTTCVSPFTNKTIIKQICSIIKGAKLYTLQSFNKNADSILNKKFFNKQTLLISEADIKDYLKIGNSTVEKCIISSL